MVNKYIAVCAYILLMSGLFGCGGNRYEVVMLPLGTTTGTVVSAERVDVSKAIAVKIDQKTGDVWIIDEYRMEYKVKDMSHTGL